MIPMQRYIAFLRAINVGGHTVKMDALRVLFESLGFINVETFIASGNVLFETPDGDPQEMETKIEACLRSALGYEVATFIRTRAELAAIVVMCRLDPWRWKTPQFTSPSYQLR